MSSFPISPPTARAGTALPRSTGASPPSGVGDFAALLTQNTARTAHAEGPKTRPQDARRDAAPRDARDDDAPPTDATTAPKADTAATPPTSDAPPATPVPAPAPADGQQPAADAAPQGEAPVPAPATDPNAAAQAALAQLPAAPIAPATPATPVAAPAGQAPALGADGLPLDPQVALAAQQAPGADAPPAGGDAAGKLQIPAELLDAKGRPHAGHQGKNPNKDGASPQDLPPAPTLPPTADATAAAPPSAPTADHAPAAPAPTPPAAQPAPAVAQAQPSATPLTQVPTAAGPGGAVLTRASVVQTAERVQELVRIATTRSGQARATLQLKPEALGQVDVHLRTTREGLVATIAAHDQSGLDALQQAGTELRRLLEDRGVQLQSLDLQLNAGQDGRGFANQGDAGQAHSGASGAASSYGLAQDDDEVVAEDELTLTPAPLTATSALVDVTA